MRESEQGKVNSQPEPSHRRCNNPKQFGPPVQAASRIYSSLDETSEDQNRSVHAWEINNTSLGGVLGEAVAIAREN